MSFQILNIIAEKAFEQLQNRQEAASNAALIARELRANNALLVASMQAVIQAAFTAEKLSRCENRLTSLNIFLEEYQNSPNDIAKLSEIDIESQYLIDTLDDADVRIAGLPSYASAGCLRISVLRLKSFEFPGDLQNAKNRAAEYARHCANTITLIHDEIEQRFAHVRGATVAGRPFEPGLKYGYYTQEPPPAFIRPRGEGQFWYNRRYFAYTDYSPNRTASRSDFLQHVNDLRSEHIREVQAEFESNNLSEVKQCIELFGSFHAN